MRICFRQLWAMVLPIVFLSAAAGGGAKSPSGDGCFIGTVRDANGSVTQTKSTFAPKEPIYFTVRSSSAKAGAQVTLEILDAHGEEVKSLFGPLSAARSVTFPFRNLEAGRYTVRGGVSGKKICEVPFEVR